MDVQETLALQKETTRSFFSHATKHCGFGEKEKDKIRSRVHSKLGQKPEEKYSGFSTGNFLDVPNLLTSPQTGALLD